MQILIGIGKSFTNSNSKLRFKLGDNLVELLIALLWKLKLQTTYFLFTLIYIFLWIFIPLLFSL